MPTSHATAEAVRISVIIPTYNAGPEFEVVLRKLSGQSIKPLEIIVVDSSSSDGTAENARKAGARVFTIPQSEFDHGGTRNFAAEQAKGEILVFMTQDAIPKDDRLLEKLTAPFADGLVAGVYAKQEARSDAAILEKLTRSFNYPDESMRKGRSELPLLGIRTFFFSNVCSAVRRDVFFDVGRFPQPVIFNEDMSMAAKCIFNNYELIYQAEAVVIHSHNYSLSQQFRRYFDNGVSMYHNDWIYAYSKVGKAGSKLVKSLVAALHRQRKWHLIPLLIAESAAKLVGYQLGKRYRMLPRSLRIRFSMHRKMWDKLQSGRGVTVQS
ncbi:glycosyltransferase family 2 protein [Paenibacillus tarimensis]